VCISSISIVLNNKEGVSAKTRDRVLKIIKESHCTPNQVGPFPGATQIPLYRDGHPQHLQLFGVPGIGLGRGYGAPTARLLPEPYFHSRRPDLEAREIENAKARGIDGIITSSGVLGTQNLPRLVEEGFPVISLLRRVYDCPQLEFVIVDHFKGGYLAAEHVIRMSHSKVAVLRGPANLSPGLQRYEGAIQAAADYGISIYSEFIRKGSFSQEFGYESTSDMLKLGNGRRPSAIVCGNDDMALGSSEAILDAGLEVGREIAVVGFNNIKTTSLKRIEITTISQKSQKMGRLAAKRLIERIENPDQGSSLYRKILEPQLVIRKSCGYTPGKYLIERRASAKLKRS